MTGSRRLTDELLSTTISLIEQSLNARIISTVSSDSIDLTGLIPNLSLLGRPEISPALDLVSEVDFDDPKRYARAQSYAIAVWSRWLKEKIQVPFQLSS